MRTQGDWYARKDSLTGKWNVWARDPEGGASVKVAEIDSGGSSEAEREANAMLIAKAPHLLEANMAWEERRSEIAEAQEKFTNG